MKAIATSIADFIREFALELRHTAICFEAMIYVYSEALTIQFKSEVHIITIAAKELDVVYILSAELGNNGFPDMFEIGRVQVVFKQRKGLLIKDTTFGNVEYSILIQPSGKDCIAPDYNEMHAGIFF
ncbi:MAG: hypothetical protein ABIQ88_23055 [Chitinophagaceae bacterium]